MRFSLLIFICLATLTLPACGTLKSTKLLAPAAFGMEQITTGVYVDPKMTPKQRLTLSESIATARQRIHSYYGNVAANPEIIACSTEQCFQRFGGETARAKACGASKLLLSPRGLTAPIVAHEWSHAELYTRVGGYFSAKDVPRWFDEGLAVLISNEPTHSEEIWLAVNEAGIATPMLNELESRGKWLAAVKKYGDDSTNKEQYKVVYATAGHEVRSWYQKAGKSGLSQLIKAIRQDRPFAQAYQEGADSIGRSSAYRNYISGPRPESNKKP